MSSMAAPVDRVIVQYAAPRTRPDWTLPEEQVPESQPHDQTLDLLKAILLSWASQSGRAVHVARNLAVRWDEAHPSVGTDPDLTVLEPAPPAVNELESLCTWKPGHAPPRLAVEVVSSRAKKDYLAAPEKCAAAGVEELWVFDAQRAGPALGGGPHRLQVWRRLAEGFVRVYAGEGPVYSAAIGGWVFAVHEGQRLRIADDERGERWWPTAEERERAEKERERAEKEIALARIAELEARLSTT